MKLIVISNIGEKLRPHRGTRSHDPKTVDLKTCVGIHDVCCGFVDIKKVSKSHQALKCRACGLRVTIPVEVETWQDLEDHMEMMRLEGKL